MKHKLLPNLIPFAYVRRAVALVGANFLAKSVRPASTLALATPNYPKTHTHILIQQMRSVVGGFDAVGQGRDNNTAARIQKRAEEDRSSFTGVRDHSSTGPARTFATSQPTLFGKLSRLPRCRALRLRDSLLRLNHEMGRKLHKKATENQPNTVVWAHLALVSGICQPSKSATLLLLFLLRSAKHVSRLLRAANKKPQTICDF